jgi:hypothetical protein
VKIECLSPLTEVCPPQGQNAVSWENVEVCHPRRVGLSPSVTLPNMASDLRKLSKSGRSVTLRPSGVHENGSGRS